MNFQDYFLTVQEKAGERMDRDAVSYCYYQGMGVMDAVILLTYCRG